MLEVKPDFHKKVKAAGDFNASACFTCGQCTAVCPMGIDVLPRILFRYVMLGIEDKVLENTETIFSCLLCKMCEVDCRPGVPISENMRALRNYINKNVYSLVGS